MNYYNKAMNLFEAGWVNLCCLDRTNPVNAETSELWYHTQHLEEQTHWLEADQNHQKESEK